MIYTGNTRNYDLDRELKSGGEGSIWTVKGRNDIVAKIYHDGVTDTNSELEWKIIYMVNNPPVQSVLDQIGWPMDILRNASTGRFAGFIMPKLDTDKGLSAIYPYKHPSEQGNRIRITIDQKLIIAINICIVISEVHKAGYVFGDFNPNNIGVNLTTGHVAFFDADTYHFRDPKSGVSYRCGVGFDGYVAPELIRKCHGTSYLEAALPTFTKETDEFALAVHIFKLLMNGYTPFNGIKESERVSQASPGRGNEAIEKDNYCFKPGNKPQSVATPDMASLPPYIQALFEKTFIDGVSDPEKRATVEEWKEALIRFRGELTACKQNPLHMYYKGNKRCPYCEADNRYLQLVSNTQSTYTTGAHGSAVGQMTFSTPVSVPSPSRPNPGNTHSAQPSAPVSASAQRRTGSRPAPFMLIFILVGIFALVGIIRAINDNMYSTRPPATTGAPETAYEEETVSSFGTKITDLKEVGYFDSLNVDDHFEPQYAEGKDLDSALKFRAGNGASFAYASFHLEGKFDRITFQALPYHLSYSSNTAIEISLIDLGTGNVVYKKSLEGHFLPTDLEANIAGIEDLRIMVNKTKSGFAYTTLKDILVYPKSEGGNSEQAGSSRTLTISVDSANIRAGAGKDYDVVSKGRRGDEFVLVEQSEGAGAENGWYEILLNAEDGTTGWVSESVVQLNDASHVPGQLPNESNIPDYGPDALNLKDKPAYDQKYIDDRIAKNFTFNDRLWTNALKFSANGEAYGIWKLDGAYSKLSLQILPYTYDLLFFSKEGGELNIINMDTQETLYSNRITRDSGVLDVNVDISGVDYLKIEVLGSAYCLLDNIYVYN